MLIKKSNIILASKSKIRKQQLIDENIDFEIIVSNIDECINNTLSKGNRLADISYRKARKVLKLTKNRDKRVIIAADQNIVFEDEMFGKPRTIEEERNFLKRIRGKDDIYAYTGNTVLLSDKDKTLQTINITDIARMSADNISNEEIEDYLKNNIFFDFCGGISITYSKFIHLKEGRLSTAKGMTFEYAKELIKNLDKM